MVKEAIRLFGSCTNVTVTKNLLHAVERAHSEYAVFLENKRKRELLEAEEKKKREQAEEAQRAKEKTKDALHEQLREQAKLEAVELQEQDAARELTSEASRKLTDALQGSEKTCKLGRCRRLC